MVSRWFRTSHSRPKSKLSPKDSFALYRIESSIMSQCCVCIALFPGLPHILFFGPFFVCPPHVIHVMNERKPFLFFLPFFCFHTECKLKKKIQGRPRNEAKCLCVCICACACMYWVCPLCVINFNLKTKFLFSSNWLSLSVQMKEGAKWTSFQAFGCTCICMYIFRVRPLLSTFFSFLLLVFFLSWVWFLWWLCHDLDLQTHVCCSNMVAIFHWWTATSLGCTVW